MLFRVMSEGVTEWLVGLQVDGRCLLCQGVCRWSGRFLIWRKTVCVIPMNFLSRLVVYVVAAQMSFPPRSWGKRGEPLSASGSSFALTEHAWECRCTLSAWLFSVFLRKDTKFLDMNGDALTVFRGTGVILLQPVGIASRTVPGCRNCVMGRWNVGTKKREHVSQQILFHTY